MNHVLFLETSFR